MASCTRCISRPHARPRPKGRLAAIAARLSWRERGDARELLREPAGAGLSAVLCVAAFLLMGFQARSIVEAMSPERLREAAWFAAACVAGLTLVRIAWVLVYDHLADRYASLRGQAQPTSTREGLLIGRCGMRGLVTLATAMALPAGFAQRELIVLTAFAVVLATLVLQGATLAPLVRRLQLDGEDGLALEPAQARAEMATQALGALSGERGRFAAFARLQEELGFSEVALRSECDRLIEEG